MALRLFAGIRKKSHSVEFELENQAKFKCFTNLSGDMVVNFLSLSITENCYLWFWVVTGEQPVAQELNLSKPFLAWKSHEFWLLTRFLLPLGFSWTENILRKGDHLVSLQSWAQLKPDRSEGGWTELREQMLLIWIKMYLTQLFVTSEKKYNCIIIQFCYLGSYTHAGSIRVHHKTFVTVAQNTRSQQGGDLGLPQCFQQNLASLHHLDAQAVKSAWRYLLNSALKWEYTKWSSQRPGNILGLEPCFPFLGKCFPCTLFQCLLYGI